MAHDWQMIASLFGDSDEIPDPEAPEPKHRKPGRDADESVRQGRASLQARDYEVAIEHFRRAMQQGGKNVEAELGAAYENADYLPAAFHQYRKAKQTHADGELSVGLADLYRRYGRLKDAAHELEEAIARDPENAYLHYRLADVLRQNGFRKAAFTAVQGAIVYAGDDAFYHYWAGDLATEMGEFGQAVPALHAAIELSPGDAHLFRLSAIALWGSGKPSEAIRAARLATDLDTDDLKSVAVLAALLVAHSLTEDAAPELEKLRKLDRFDFEESARILARIELSPPIEPPA